MLTRVEGGTGAGRRMHVRTVSKSGWRCAAGHENQGYAATCLAFGCREKRPQKEST